ncbi:MAG: response regulator transcription factor [Phycisphaerae bacterium]|nr:response regulator transcription factor [Phycisphaerae bacterium]
MMRMMIVDDHKLMVQGIRLLLTTRMQVDIVAEGFDGEEAVQLAREVKPEFILMDISMPKLNGIEAAQKILSELPSIKIIILSMHAEARIVQEALQAGCRGYVLKDAILEDLVNAIKTVSRGEVYVHPLMT